MSGLFPSRASSSEPWFRLGRLEVSTVMAVVLAVAASWLAWVANTSLQQLLAFSPGAVAAGDLWRIVTWPLANRLGLWDILSLFFFWYFGSELEGQIGRTRMAWLLLGAWASLTVASALVGIVLGGGLVLAGIGLIQFAVLLLWIAEYPTRPFFFGIPAWIVGLVLAALQVLQLIAIRSGGSVLSLLLGFVLIALVAKQVGLLGDQAWIPGGRRPGRRPQARAQRNRAQPARQAREQRRRASDTERLDELLDRINERGIDSLSDAERRELKRLRERRRG